ncbi:hypothetical protein M8818_005368 [Zalaria obscura]|uniref:Uncharacterized protein n=1 Tax=Zalaria obscura TaxID=2024903 RepID=A0ACC3SC98_9PEZI
MESSRPLNPAFEGVDNPRPEAISPREMCPQGDICRRCEEVLHELKWPVIRRRNFKEGEYSSLNDEALVQNIYVGTVVEMAATTGCAFCSFLLRTLNEDYLGQPDPPVGRVEFTQLRGHCYISGGTQRITRQGMRKRWQLVAYYEDSSLPLEIYAPIRLLAESAEEVNNGEVILDLERSVDHSPCDQGFINGCYETCRLQCEDCEQPKDILGKGLNNTPSVRDNPQDMRIIDILRKCITIAPHGCRYFALSYCWGVEQSLQLRKDNILQLTQEGFLDNASGVTETIQGAIEVTRLCNERFLWVDSLCIIQDDASDKSVQIYQMDKIYRHAALTIVAAGDDIKKGLPGLKHGSRSPPVKRVKVRRLSFQLRLPGIREAIISTRWQSRAWTYQEAQMSKRKLVFTAYQVFYECKARTLAEASVSHVEFTPGWLDPEDPRTRWNEELLGSRDYGIMTLEVAIEAITGRDLTYENDILNAISGLLAAVAQAHNESFLCGMLLSTFLEHSMLWTPMVKLRRREPDAGGHNFPSWSWAGWVGKIEYAFDERFGNEGHNYIERREIDAWSVILPDGTYVREEELNSAQGPLPIQSCMLRFRSEVAIFSVDPLRYSIPYYWSIRDKVATHRIFHSSIWIGSVILSRADAEALFVDARHRELCFIKLSREKKTLNLEFTKCPYMTRSNCPRKMMTLAFTM